MMLCLEEAEQLVNVKICKCSNEMIKEQKVEVCDATKFN